MVSHNYQYSIFAVFEMILLAACTQTKPMLSSPVAIEASVVTPSILASKTPLFTERPEANQTPITTFSPEAEQVAARVAFYDLGETTLLQAHFPEDSHFRNMPVRLLGVIGVPGGKGPYPVVLILHGSPPVCPGEDVWPCAEEEERPNYAGFTYLVEALAIAGYVALSINVNAEYTFAFGEAPPTLHTIQLIDAHLMELAAANRGESDKFGLDLTGRVDLSRMMWMGYSRGGDYVNWIVRQQNLAVEADQVEYGPVKGLILMAPPVFSTEALPTIDLPVTIILPTCDSDVINLDGQLYYESARFDPSRAHPVTSVYLEGGNHNNFNTLLQLGFSLEHRPDCSENAILTPEAQRNFLVQYTLDFLQWLFGDPSEGGEIAKRLGLNATLPMPARLYDFPVRISTLYPPANHLTVVQPQSKAELNTNLLGGKVKMGGVTAVFCPKGNYVPDMEPGTESCKRVNFNQPGYSQQLILSWETPDAQWRTSLPEPVRNLTSYTSLQLRAALDPLSDLNAQGESQAFTLLLMDASGDQASVVVTDLPYSSGDRQPNGFFEGGLFSGHVYMNDMIVPLSQFSGIDIANVTEIAFDFDQRDTGTLFIADLALIK